MGKKLVSFLFSMAYQLYSIEPLENLDLSLKKHFALLGFNTNNNKNFKIAMLCKKHTWKGISFLTTLYDAFDFEWLNDN